MKITKTVKRPFAPLFGAGFPSRSSGKFLLFLLFLLFVLLLPGLAFAEGGEQTALQNLTDQVFAILTPVVLALVAAFGSWILLKVKQKLNLDVSERTTMQWQDLARQAALRGAEWARKKAKELAGDKKIPGPDVMEVAANWAIDMAVQQGLPALARQKLEGLIEAELFKLRIEQAPTAPADPYDVATAPKV